MTAPPPARFGRYEVVRPLGRGAVGEVHLARDPTLNRQVAIKTLSGLSALPPGEQEQATDKFLREARAAAALSHPNIVTIYDVGEQDGLPYMAMEYLEGTTLDRHAREGHLLPPEKVVEIGIRAALALDEAHRAGLVHRDVKPANLILLGDGSVKVTDFGLAKDPRTALTSDQTLVGTPNYMSPEQIAGRELDGRSDLFSLAVSLFEMLAGTLPFPGDSISSVLYRIVNERPLPLRDVKPDLPEALEDLLETMMAKDRDDRMQDGRALAAALRAILETMGGVPQHLVIPPPDAPTRPTTSAELSAPSGEARRRRWPLVAFVLVALVALAAAAWTAPGWAGFDPLGGARAPIESWVRQNAPEAVADLGVSPVATRVPVRTDPPGLPWRVETDGITRVDDGLEVPPDFSGPIVVTIADGCVRGEARVAGGALPPEVLVPTEPAVVEVPVRSEPAGARVSVDGADVEGRTPLDISLAACRAHEVVVEADGRPERTIALAADAGADAWARALSSVELAPPPPGYVVVPEAPYPVRVTAAPGGRSLGRAGQRIELDPGRRRLVLSAPDVLFSQEITVRIEPGEVTRPRVDYPPLGRLTVRAVPPGGDVLLRPGGSGSARRIGETPLNGHAVVAGTYDVVVEHPTKGVQVMKSAVVQGGSDPTVVVVGAGDWP